MILKDQDVNILESHIQDKKISFAIVYQFCMLITNYVIKHLFNVKNPLARAVISFIFMIMVGILFLKNFKIVIKRIGKLFINLYLVSGIIFLFNILFFNKNIKSIIDVSFWFFLICLPVFLYYLAIKDKAVFLDMIIKSAYYQIALGILFFVTSDFSVLNYDMVYSYLIMVPVIMLIYKVYNKFKILDFALIIMGLISIIIMGSRGPILSIILFFITLLFLNFFKKENNIKTRIISFFIIIVLLLSFFYIDQILYEINILFMKFGIKSRTINLLTNENADFLTGRLNLYKMTIKKILERPIIGYGLAGDRIFLNGTYPHNIFLEVLAQFGVVLGSLILFIFMFYWFNGIILNKNKEEQDLAIIFFGIGLIQLFVSGSYLTSANYWLFMAICVSSVHFRK